MNTQRENTTRKNVLLRIRQVARSMSGDASMWLYGSEARGEARPDSDVDILILTPKHLSIKEQQVLSVPLYDIELETGIQINPYFALEEQWNSRTSLFTSNVNKERIML